MKRSLIFASALALTLCALLSACGSSDSSSDGSSDGGTKSAAKDFKACLVSGTGGIDDRGFNQSAWEGVQEGIARAGQAEDQAKVLQPKSDTDYAPQIQAFVAQKCDLIVAAGFEAADATVRAAKANPDQKFAIVDVDVQPPLENVASLVFDSGQVSFLGGYLAAGISRTGKVGTFGGTSNPAVNYWMDGFYGGVQHYNEVHDADVSVIGWSEPTQKGLYSESYSDQTKGKQLAEQLMSQGADTVFPVAGNVNVGAAQAIKEAGDGFAVMWSDTDGCAAASQFCSVFLGSPTKNIRVTVARVVVEAFEDRFEGGTHVGTLENGGIGFIYPRGAIADRISAELRGEWEQLKQDVADGTIVVESRNKPKAG